MTTKCHVVGVLCDDEVQSCESSPCQHDGTCHSDILGVFCTCSHNYEGIFCQLRKGTVQTLYNFYTNNLRQVVNNYVF